MTIGSRRRAIIPPNLGYTDSGLGPFPINPSHRRRLGGVIDLVLANKGQLVADVELVYIGDDENDLGYYEDDTVSPQEIRDFVQKAMEEGSFTNAPIPATNPREDSIPSNNK